MQTFDIFAIKLCTKISDFNRGKKVIYDIDCNEYSDINSMIIVSGK